MQTQLRKVKKYFSILSENLFFNKTDIKDISICPAGYKKGNTPPPLCDFKPFSATDTWGEGADTHAWFHFNFSVPSNMQKYPLRLNIDTEHKTGWNVSNPQFICYIDGVMRQGIDVNHTFVSLDAKDSYDVYLYAYTGFTTAPCHLFASIANVHQTAYELYYDIKVPLEALKFLDERSKEYAEILAHLDNAVSLFDLYEVASDDYFVSLKRAKEYMDNEFYGKYCSKQPSTSVCIGHTHIDCAWLWTLKQTREKVQRSFSTVIELMKQYPEYKFMSSQAFLYKNVKEEAPEIYEQIKKRVAEGRWEPEGAMWVEADCNITSGESLVRQVMFGKRFFRDEFGVENRVLWLPDVFGYSAALPQILKKSGVDWFVTSKISWNDTNTMPYDTFAWSGIDGTKINTYFLTAQNKPKGNGFVPFCTYNAEANAATIAGTYSRYQQKNLNDEVLVSFGYGDGGGGPTADYLEQLRRTEKGIPGLSNSKIEFAGDFLKKLEGKIENNRLLPEWKGELYLEYHRGTYTSIAKNKKNNRECEFMYLDAELLSETVKHLFGKEFPKESLHNGWEMILTNQFHDIIPGSSIKEVYDQCDIDYKKIKSIGRPIIEDARSSIASHLDKSKGYVIFNPHSFVGEGLVEIDGKSAFVSNIAPKGYTLTNSLSFDNSVKIDDRTVETDCLKVLFDEHWQIISIYDKKQEREVLSKGKIGNEIRIYADHPDKYDAWEWQAYSRDDYKALTDVKDVSVVDNGARKGIKITRAFMESTITQTIWFNDNATRIDFETVADWHQTHKMVKAAFPVDINADKASYEIQFGTVERPTHFNTSWDKAKFEVCAQKYADISEGDYGVSILNNCKYGHDIHGGEMLISLFKSPTYPNPEADQGIIDFTYSLYMHKGALSASDTAKQSYYLNYPLTAKKATAEASTIPESFSMISVSKENIICETIKQAEDSTDTIVRLYESKNTHSAFKLQIGFDAKKCFLCDLQENELSEVSIDNGVVKLEAKPFEIITLKFVK